VSWNVPAVQVNSATFVLGVPTHSWQATACAGGTIGVNGMMGGGKVDGAHRDRSLHRPDAHPARAGFEAKRGPNFVYSTKLADRKPALDYRK
jgi:aminobenzoyl-glutamate utilization protein B